MVTQPQAIMAAAELIVESAKELGAACKLPADTEAATILEVAYGIAVAQMIGPGGSRDRLEGSVRTARGKISQSIREQTFLRFGVSRN